MARGLRLPSALRDRRLSPLQERLIHELYAAKEKTVLTKIIKSEVFRGDVDTDRVGRLVHETRKVIQGTGWHIETDHSRGYRMIWVDKYAAEEPPETLEILREIVEDQRAIRADMAMLAHDFRQALASITTVPAYMLVPSSVWTRELDNALMDTKGITGKLSKVAAAYDVDPTAATSRFKALKSSR